MSNNNIPPQQQSFQPRTLSDYQQLLSQLKLQAANTNGSISQILSDVNSDWHNNVVRMIKPILMEKEALEKQLTAKMQELEKVYNAHPELKISMQKPKTSPKKVKV